MLINKLKYFRHYATKPSSSFYATTPIFYVNAAPHIGHLYSAVIADAICRYQRLLDPDASVHLCTGTDEHGTKIQQAAAIHNVPVSKYCDDISSSYRTVFQQALIANSDFIRTTEQRHAHAVQHFWRSLKSRGHIYSAQYSGWYCVSDETFLTDSQLKVDATTGERYSIESGHPVEWTEETNFMFSLSKFQDDIINWVKSREGHRVRPAKFEKILLDYLSEPLPDVSVSRPANRVHWAITVPEDETQTVYVWLDALINYLTSVGYPNESYKSYWPPNVQVIGKDILKFHGIYWPAFLIAAGLEPPKELFVHSHWTVNGQKMSKSKENVVDPQEAAKTYTMEGLRYFLLREGVAHSDGNYSSIKAHRILNSELADTLGNLLSRGCAKTLNPRQVYPRLHREQFEHIQQLDAAKRLHEALQQLEPRCAQHYNDNNFYLVVDTVISTLHAANNFFESTRPWELKNNNSSSRTKPKASNESETQLQQEQEEQDITKTNKLETILAMTMDTLRLCGIALQPIVPALSTRLLDKLSVPHTARLWRNLNESFASGCIATEKPLHSGTDAVLFRRIILKEEDTTGEGSALKTTTPTIKKKSNKPSKVKKVAH